jgi:hypothetical protein
MSLELLECEHALFNMSQEVLYDKCNPQNYTLGFLQKVFSDVDIYTVSVKPVFTG